MVHDSGHSSEGGGDLTAEYLLRKSKWDKLSIKLPSLMMGSAVFVACEI